MQLSIQTLVDPQSIRIVRKVGLMVALEAGFGAAQGSEVEVALSEALSNAFFHAYRGTPGPVHVDIRIENRELRLQVRDEGPVLADPPTVPASLPDADARGLYLMTQLMDTVELVHPSPSGQGTLIRLMKRLEPPLGGPTGDFHSLVFIG